MKCKASVIAGILVVVAAAVALVGPAASADGPCGCMDVVLVVDDTGSMGPAIANVKAGLANIINAAVIASGGDLRMGVVTFSGNAGISVPCSNEEVEVDQPFTANMALVTAAVNALAAGFGCAEPEASDEALNYVVTGATPCTLLEPQGPLGAFRSGCLKIIVLVTDATPGGCDDIYADGVDDVNAAAVAAAAAAAGIKISAVLVDNGSEVSGAHPGGVEPDVMSNYAATTGGAFVTVPSDGSGTGAAIESIIKGCGGVEIAVPVDIKPTSCPNPLNTNDKGVLPVAICGTSSLDVTQIDVSTVQLEGVSPLRSAIEDVATPFSPFTGKKDCRLDCTTAGPDGFRDLTLKFSAQAVVAALGAVQDRECRVLKLTGKLLDGTPIAGEDVVIILKKK